MRTRASDPIWRDMKSPADDRPVEETLAALQMARVPNDRVNAERAEIASRVANFRAHQERFKLERDAFYRATRAKIHSALESGRR
jgi:hypothetical protein